MTPSIEKADVYFEESVVFNDAWVNADEQQKNRALKNATNVLNRQYPKRNVVNEAIFEQAIWLLKISEARKQAEQGVTSYSVDGISVTLSQVDRSISPEVISILGRRFAPSQSDRKGYIVTQDEHVRRPSGGYDR